MESKNAPTVTAVDNRSAEYLADRQLRITFFGPQHEVNCMKRRVFLIGLGGTVPIAGCISDDEEAEPTDTSPSDTDDDTGPEEDEVEDGNGSNQTDDEADNNEHEETADLINVADHYFEKFAVDDVNGFVTVENISNRELRVEVEISVFDDNIRLANMEGRIRDLPAGITEEISNITLVDLDEPEAVTHYIIEVRACTSDTGFCNDVEPIEMEFDGDEYRDRLEGEWINP